jgi:predicted dehydrogenase
MAEKTVRCGVIGYGGAFNMGRAHLAWIKATPGLVPVAACDKDASRMEAARKDYPGIKTFTNYKEMLKDPDIDLVVCILPHYLHCPVVLDILRSGKHAVTEKPMCLTVKEADAMIAEAKKQKRVFSPFHNRRWDGDHLAMMSVVKGGEIGEVFHIEAFMGGFNPPRDWWRSDKKLSGGAFYDWGAHMMDWVLRLMDAPIEAVGGLFHKRVWRQVTNEDQCEAIIRFEGGKGANVQLSSIARAGKPRFRILGTKGAILDPAGQGAFKLLTLTPSGRHVEGEVKYQLTDWRLYYQNLADHLLRGGKLECTPESARRNIMVIEYAERASKAGRLLKTPYE